MAAERSHAGTLFFPAAALYGALLIPASLNAAAGGPPAALAGLGHPLEAFQGFLLALIAGYTLGPLPARRLTALFALWLAGRLAFYAFPFGLPAALAGSAFGLAVAGTAAPRFAAAKKWRNRLTAPLLAVLGCLPALFWLQPIFDWPVPRAIGAGLALVVMLMAYMSGRMLAAAAGAESERRGLPRPPQVQPRLEGGLLLSAPAAALAAGIGWSRLAGVALFACGALLALRALRWRPWRWARGAAHLGLLAGHLWLTAGALAVGAAWWRGAPAGAAVHLITVGALGCLAASVILRQAAGRRRAPARLGTVLLLLSAATLARLAAGAAPAVDGPWPWAAALAWSAAWLLVSAALLKRPAQPPGG